MVHFTASVTSNALMEFFLYLQSLRGDPIAARSTMRFDLPARVAQAMGRTRTRARVSSTTIRAPAASSGANRRSVVASVDLNSTESTS